MSLQFSVNQFVCLNGKSVYADAQRTGLGEVREIVFRQTVRQAIKVIKDEDNYIS